MSTLSSTSSLLSCLTRLSSSISNTALISAQGLIRRRPREKLTLVSLERTFGPQGKDTNRQEALKFLWLFAKRRV